MANGLVYLGSNQGVLWALNAATGSRAWAVPARVIESSPAYANGVLHAGTDGGSLRVFDAATGQR